jgi:hypothetical protein
MTVRGSSTAAGARCGPIRHRGEFILLLADWRRTLTEVPPRPQLRSRENFGPIDASSLSDLNAKSLISLQFALSNHKRNRNDINMLALISAPSPTGC